MSLSAPSLTTTSSKVCIEIQHHIFDVNQLDSKQTRLSVDSVDTFQRFKGSKKFFTNKNGTLFFWNEVHFSQESLWDKC